jgi:hypothetical protein
VLLLNECLLLLLFLSLSTQSGNFWMHSRISAGSDTVKRYVLLVLHWCLTVILLYPFKIKYLFCWKQFISMEFYLGKSVAAAVIRNPEGKLFTNNLCYSVLKHSCRVIYLIITKHVTSVSATVLLKPGVSVATCFHVSTSSSGRKFSLCSS